MNSAITTIAAPGASSRVTGIPLSVTASSRTVIPATGSSSTGRAISTIEKISAITAASPIFQLIVDAAAWSSATKAAPPIHAIRDRRGCVRSAAG